MITQDFVDSLKSLRSSFAGWEFEQYLEYDAVADTLCLVHHFRGLVDTEQATAIELIQQVFGNSVRSYSHSLSKGRGRKRADGSAPTESLTTYHYLKIG